jgi:hypothetical protein
LALQGLHCLVPVFEYHELGAGRLFSAESSCRHSSPIYPAISTPADRRRHFPAEPAFRLSQPVSAPISGQTKVISENNCAFGSKNLAFRVVKCNPLGYFVEIKMIIKARELIDARMGRKTSGPAGQGYAH